MAISVKIGHLWVILIKQAAIGGYRMVKASPVEENDFSSKIAGAGILAGLLMTLFLALCRALGFTVLNIEMGLGGIITRTIGTGTWILGFIFHLLIAASITTLYVKGFKFLGRVGWLPGFALAPLHWTAIGLLMGILPQVHKMIKFFPVASHTLTSPEILRPGYFGSSLGLGTVFSLLVAHLIYGTVVGTLSARYWNTKNST